MATKQEKLAAARKKLKEFQGKQREPENPKPINVPDIGTPSQLQQNLLHLSAESSPSQTPTIGEQNSSVIITQKDNGSGWRNPSSGFHFEETLPSLETNRRSQNSATSWLDINQQFININTAFSGGCMPPLDVNNQNNSQPVDFNIQSSHPNNSIETNSNDIFKSSLINDKNSYQLNNNENNNKPFQDSFKDKSGSITPEIDFSKKTHSYPNTMLPTRENSSACHFDNPEYSIPNRSGSSALDSVIQPLQTELQNHAQTINILVQQRNDAQNAVAQAQSVLNEKLDEISKQGQQIMSLTQTISDLNKRLTESESLAKNFRLENDTKVQEIKEINMKFHTLKSQLDFKEEECLELRRKYEEKCKECHHILYSLNEMQSQLSLCQIKIQNQIQASDDTSEVLKRVETLESEKIQLGQQLEALGKELEAANSEKEHSGQNFKVYVQRCNAELETLNSQLKELTSANANLKQRNEALARSSLEVERLKDDVNAEEYKNEIANLHDQINELAEMKTEIEEKYHKVEEEISNLKKDLMEKDVRLHGMTETMKDLESENKKLLLEVNLPKSGEANLLAAIESDKVAAAKAVSQNQKLKSQIMELEEAFVKMSEEKLQLTDQLSHEKHLNKELQNRLNGLESRDNGEHEHEHYCHDGHDHKDDGHSHSDHDHGHSKEEPLVNDSQEIDELKRIIRQLQDDKMELKSRLNISMTTEMTASERKELRRISTSSELTATERRELRRLSAESETDELKHEDAKLRLQQMEEKVRKTMNEIAILDEEKEKLEHLVLQLQGETETIGEYIALYQKQRMLLKQRAQEKDVQLIQLSKDKEELKTKLNDLDELVQHLLGERNGAGEAADETAKSQVNTSLLEETENTAVKIRALISEIGSTSLINNQSVAFKHCSCCSGRLITI